MTQTQATVRRHVVVDSAIDRAFSVFTERFGDFKPLEHNLLSAPIAETIFEPRVGGHIFDRAVDGTECRWARILVYEPPVRVVFSWDISPEWTLETDLDRTSEIEVRSYWSASELIERLWRVRIFKHPDLPITIEINSALMRSWVSW
jgi:hypothetical protein